MEMPKNCCECPFTVYEDACVFTGVIALSIGRQDACPLVPLPEWHGRLIDADALIKNHFSDEHRIALSYANKLWMRRIINGEPTIVPAEGGGEDG
jgi:hypothetical protein